MNPSEKTGADKVAQSSNLLASIILLTIVTLLAFANAWHDSLVLDDKFFVGENSSMTLESLFHAFKIDVWMSNSGLYRPLLLIFFQLETNLFGAWNQAYHVVNILLHLSASLLLFGFLRHLLTRHSDASRNSDLAALLAAMVFAVHPIHTEVVNSVFNGSEIWVSIFAISGLWWLMHNLDSKPFKAWAGLGATYSLAIFFKESALVIPGLAVLLIMLMTEGTFWTRIRRTLPVFSLLIPIAVYFYLRGSAFSAFEFESTTAVGIEGQLSAAVEGVRTPGIETLKWAAAVTGESLKVIMWPYPLRLYYPSPWDLPFQIYLITQLLLISLSLVMLAKGRPALALALGFFYIAMLPSSRLLTFGYSFPHVAERYLYFPSVGLAIGLLFATRTLLDRFGRKLISSVALIVILLLSALSWERNTEWASQFLLFETDYDQGHRGSEQIRLLVAAHVVAGHRDRVATLCDDNIEAQLAKDEMANTCGVIYLRMERIEDSIASFERAAKHERSFVGATLNLGRIYISQGQLQKGADYYVSVINHLTNPAQKEYYQAEMISKIYPRSRTQLNIAREHLHKALELNPDYSKAQDLLDELNNKLQESVPPKSSADEAEQ